MISIKIYRNKIEKKKWKLHRKLFYLLKIVKDIIFRVLYIYILFLII